MQAQTQSRGNPALQNGLLFGIILGGIEVLFSLTLGNVGFLICLIIYLGMVGFAGYRASARTGKVSTGLVAGLLVGLFSSIIGSLGLFFYTLPNIDTLRQQLQLQANNLNQGFAINYTNNVVIGLLVLLLVILILASSLLALGIGAIGGAIGKGNAPAQLTPNPPYPYGGQYPDPGNAPAQSTPNPPYPYSGQYPEPRYMPPPAYPPQEFVPPQMYPPAQQKVNPPAPQNYPPLPEDYMTPPAQENKQDGV